MNQPVKQHSTFKDNPPNRKNVSFHTNGNRVEPVDGSSLSNRKQRENREKKKGNVQAAPHAQAGGASGADSLPCLYSNNSGENVDETSMEPLKIKGEKRVDKDLNKLCPYHKKQAEVLFRNTKAFIDKYGLENVGFLTLTFRDNVRDNKEAGRRFNNMNGEFLSEHFGGWMLVKERQKRGAWHYHLLVDCKTDIRTGIDFNAIKSGDYSSASAGLRRLWSLLRKELPKYNFGRAELLPIRSNSEGLARYVGKYIAKHVGGRIDEDKGVRLFSCSKGFKAANTCFMWHSVGSWLWRQKVKAWAHSSGVLHYEDIKKVFGNKWAWKYAGFIESVPLSDRVIYPTLDHWRAAKDFPEEAVPFGVPLDAEKNGTLYNIRVRRTEEGRHVAVEYRIYSPKTTGEKDNDEQGKSRKIHQFEQLPLLPNHARKSQIS